MSNYDACLAFVWATGRDSPADGCHIDPADPGGATNGGVVQATWDHACRVGIAEGKLASATRQQLSDILQATCWYPTCPLVPAGLDLMIFNGVMMSGSYRRLVQQCLGLMGAAVDGWIGPMTLGRINRADPDTLIDALSGAHYAYLHALLGLWPRFGAGWTVRIQAAQETAHSMARAVPPGPPPPPGIRLSS